MIHTADHVRTAHVDGFSRATHRLAEARQQQRQKDTPAHRAAVTARLAEVDAVLDAHLEAQRRGRLATRASTEAA